MKSLAVYDSIYIDGREVSIDEAWTSINHSTMPFFVTENMYPYSPYVGESVLVPGTTVGIISSDSIDGFMYIDEEMSRYSYGGEYLTTLISDIYTDSNGYKYDDDVINSYWTYPSSGFFGIGHNDTEPRLWYVDDYPEEYIGNGKYRIYVMQNDEGYWTLSLEQGRLSYLVEGPLANVWYDTLSNVIDYVMSSTRVPRFTTSFSDVDIDFQ